MVLAVASLMFAPQPSLAFVARFYKSGNAMSRFELYISDLEGTNRKMLPTSEEPRFVQWIGKDRLAWTTESGIWTSPLSSWKPVLVKGSKNFVFRESRWRAYEPGNPDLIKDYDETKGLYRLNLQKMKIEQTVPVPNHEEMPLSDEAETRIPDPNNPDHPLSLKKYEPFTYWVDGKEVESDLEAMRILHSGEGRYLWLIVGTHDSTSGNVNGVMLFESGKKPRTIFEDANAFDFWKNRSTFAYCTGRTTTTMGKKEVWTSELYVGDWQKGTNKNVIKGLVWVPSVSIRP